MRIRFYIWLMGISGTISAWAWREHVKILRAERIKKTKRRYDDLE